MMAPVRPQHLAARLGAVSYARCTDTTHGLRPDDVVARDILLSALHEALRVATRGHDITPDTMTSLVLDIAAHQAYSHSPTAAAVPSHVQHAYCTAIATLERNDSQNEKNGATSSA